MKNLFTKILAPETCGRIVILSSLAILFIMGMNYLKLVIPEKFLVLAITILLFFGLTACFAKFFWSFYFWNQYPMARKFEEIIKGAFYTIFLSFAVFIAIKFISLSFK